MTPPTCVRATLPAVASFTLQQEVLEAAQDNFGQVEGPDLWWFPTETHALAFIRRVTREVPSVTVELSTLR